MAMVEVQQLQVQNLDKPYGDYNSDTRDRFTRAVYASGEVDLTNGRDGLHEARLTLADGTQMWVKVHNNMIVHDVVLPDGTKRRQLMGFGMVGEKPSSSHLRLGDHVAPWGDWQLPASLDLIQRQIKTIEVSREIAFGTSD